MKLNIAKINVQILGCIKKFTVGKYSLNYNGRAKLAKIFS